MTTYNSYEEAKIANPESEIVTETQKSIEEFSSIKRFHPVIENDFFTSGYEYIYNKGSSPRVHDGYFEVCNPADHCMTVEEFLKAGHKFVNGDIYMYSDGLIETVDSAIKSNKINMGDSSRYILRAAALENKMNTDRLETQSEEQPKRVKVEYLKVDFVSDKEKAEAFIEGGLRYLTHGEIRGDLESDTIPVTRLDELLCGNSIYRRIETEITERDEFIQGYLELADSSVGVSYKEFAGIVFDKLVEGE